MQTKWALGITQDQFVAVTSSVMERMTQLLDGEAQSTSDVDDVAAHGLRIFGRVEERGAVDDERLAFVSAAVVATQSAFEQGKLAS